MKSIREGPLGVSILLPGLSPRLLSRNNLVKMTGTLEETLRDSVIDERAMRWDGAVDFGDWIRGEGSIDPPRENIVIEVPPCRLASGTQWVLPASKSHLIRWIALGCQGNGALRIEHVGELGEDITHMIRGLESLGARIQISDGAVTVSPRDGKFLRAP